MEVSPKLFQVHRRPAEVRTPGEVVEGVRRLVVVRLDRLGDLVLTLPAVDALRRAYPAAKLALMVRPALEPLARLVGGVDTVLGVEDRAAPIREALETFGADLVVCISRGAAGAWGATRAGIPCRVGTGNRVYSPLFTRRVGERRRRGGRHEAEYALSFAHRSGAAPGQPHFRLAVPPEAGSEVSGWLEERGVDGAFVVLHPGTGGSCPSWPIGHYLDLAARLRSAGARVVISIGPGDSAIASAIDAADDAAARECPTHEGELSRLPALLTRAAVVVSNSTGPLHLAAALGTRTLGLYAPWSTCGVARWGPYAANGWALVAECEPAKSWSRSERARNAPALMGGIPPELASSCVESLLRGDSPRHGPR